MLFTIFTPTYNRGHLLRRLYDSLCAQTDEDFEWLIVDDGSNDDTQQIVSDFIKQHLIRIRYFVQANSGKHRAINRGICEADGELFFIVDSDDSLPPDSLSIIREVYNGIQHDSSFAGVGGHRGFMNGRIIGSGYPELQMDASSLEIAYKYHVKGDLAEVFRVQVLREFPFPEIEGEKFCPEDLVWHRIAAKYKLRYFKRIIYLADYQPDGLTARIAKVRMLSPITSTMFYSELIRREVPMKIKLRSAINYWRFRLCGKSSKEMKKLPLLWNIVMPLGWAMHQRDKKKFLQ